MNVSSDGSKSICRVGATQKQMQTLCITKLQILNRLKAIPLYSVLVVFWDSPKCRCQPKQYSFHKKSLEVLVLCNLRSVFIVR